MKMCMISPTYCMYVHAVFDLHFAICMHAYIYCLRKIIHISMCI